MPFRTLPLAIAILLVLLPQGAAADSTARIIIQREPGLSAAERADIRADAGADFVETLAVPRTEVVEVSRAELASALRKLDRDPDVAAVQPDRIVHALAPPSDFNATVLWGLNKISMPAAWEKTRGAGSLVAVADSGVLKTHADLDDRLAPGYDWVDQDTEPQDGNGHGTHVTGTVVASQNDGGVVGVAPRARALSLRVLNNDGSGRVSDILEAFQFAGQEGIRVVNASLGAVGALPVERNVIASQPGTLFVTAAGNSNVNNDVLSAADYPCAYDLANILCVGASTQSDTRASFSNYGATTVDVFAPGVGIVSTYKNSNSSYASMQGTSMAAPHVAGIAALLLARNPRLTTTQLKDAIMDTVDPGSGLTSVTGGRVNANAALASVMPDLDGDGVEDDDDNCSSVPNADQDPGQSDVPGGLACEDGVPDDYDGDGVVNAADACPYVSDPDGCPGTMSDGDGDAQPDMLDDCPATPGNPAAQGCVDTDGDTVADHNPVSGRSDNCVTTPNADQSDLDGDGIGDACDPTPRGHDNDMDAKAAIDDACPNTYGTLPNGCPAPPPPSPPNGDGDGFIDAQDACPFEAAFTANGCPVPALTALSGKVKKRGTRRWVIVRASTTRAATLRILVQRKVGRRWVKVKRRNLATIGNRVTLKVTRLRRGRHRVVVAVYSNAGTGTPATRYFTVR